MRKGMRAVSDDVDDVGALEPGTRKRDRRWSRGNSKEWIDRRDCKNGREPAHREEK